MRSNFYRSLSRAMRYGFQWSCLCVWLLAPVAQAQDGPSALDPDAPGSTPPQSSQPPQSYPLKDVEISLTRGACFGTCPVYEVSIFGDGRVVYQGRRFVRVEGEQQSTVDKDQVMKLLDRLYAIYFFDMKDAYQSHQGVFEHDGVVEVSHSMISDVPSQIVRVRLGEYEKTVSHQIGGPPGLKELFDLIDEVAGSKRWIE